MNGEAPSRGVRALGPWLAGWALKLPVHAYRFTLKPFVGWHCRHLPTCSEYALDAIDLNGPWRGGWLALSRLCRCHRWGTAGYDPVPDCRGERHTLAPWRYGRWSGRHIVQAWTSAEGEHAHDRAPRPADG
jgi:hypothetical protein